MRESNIRDNSLRNSVTLTIEILIDPAVQSPAEPEMIQRAVLAAARWRQFTVGEIGVRISDDPTIQRINQKHLQHDYPTDVISFLYQADPPRIEGELIVSVDTARRRADQLNNGRGLIEPLSLSGESPHLTIAPAAARAAGRTAARRDWESSHELLLYTVHGVLHLTGMDDTTASQRREMRGAEAAIMTELGIPNIARYGADIDRGAVTEPQP